MFNKIVSELIEEFGLDNLVDEIMVKRAAMYLVHMARAETYEATVGVSDKSAYWGAYIARMDNMVRNYFNDLAISRAKRLQLEKGDAMLVSLDEVMRKFASTEKKKAKPKNQEIKFRSMSDRSYRLSLREQLWLMWGKEYPKLKSKLKKREKDAKQEAEKSAS